MTTPCPCGYTLSAHVHAPPSDTGPDAEPGMPWTEPKATCWRHDYEHREYVCRCDPPREGDTGYETG